MLSFLIDPDAALESFHSVDCLGFMSGCVNLTFDSKCGFMTRTSCWRSAGTSPKWLGKTWRKLWTAAASLLLTKATPAPLWVKPLPPSSPLLELDVFFLTLSCRRSAMLRHPRVLQELRTDPAGVRRPGAALRGRHRPLLQLHWGQSVGQSISWLIDAPAGSMPPVRVKLGGHLKALPVCSRFLACGWPTSTGTWRTLDRTPEPFCSRSDRSEPNMLRFLWLCLWKCSSKCAAMTV